jgi:hypothetical protein
MKETLRWRETWQAALSSPASPFTQADLTPAGNRKKKRLLPDEDCRGQEAANP